MGQSPWDDITILGHCSVSVCPYVSLCVLSGNFGLSHACQNACTVARVSVNRTQRSEQTDHSVLTTLTSCGAVLVVVAVCAEPALLLAAELVVAGRHGERLRLRRLEAALRARHRLVLLVPAKYIILV